MPNPNFPQGSLNRLRASVGVPDNDSLNVTAPFLGTEGVSLSFEGAATQFFGTMTGAVTSGEPYQACTVTINLLKTQGLAQLWEAQRQANSLIGDITVTTDTSTLNAYQITNCGIENVRELKFAGQDPSYMVTVRGYYLINSDLFDG